MQISQYNTKLVDSESYKKFSTGEGIIFVNNFKRDWYETGINLLGTTYITFDIQPIIVVLLLGIYMIFIHHICV